MEPVDKIKLCCMGNNFFTIQLHWITFQNNKVNAKSVLMLCCRRYDSWAKSCGTVFTCRLGTSNGAWPFRHEQWQVLCHIHLWDNGKPKVYRWKFQLDAR